MSSVNCSGCSGIVGLFIASSSEQEVKTITATIIQVVAILCKSSFMFFIFLKSNNVIKAKNPLNPILALIDSSPLSNLIAATIR